MQIEEAMGSGASNGPCPWKGNTPRSQSLPSSMNAMEEEKSWHETQMASATSLVNGAWMESSEDGISIPSFLQPLLGIDFVPYMPSLDSLPLINGEEGEDDSASIEPQKLTDEDLEDLDLMGPSNSSEFLSPEKDANGDARTATRTIATATTASASLSVPTLAQRRRKKVDENDESHGNVEVALSQFEEERAKDGVMLFSPSSKRSRPIRKFMKKLVKGRKRSDSSSNSKRTSKSSIKSTSRRSRLSTLDNSELPGEGHDIGATDQAESPVIQNHLRWLSMQQGKMTGHYSHLERVQAETKLMRAKTEEIGNRVGSIQNEILYLQEALKNTEERLRQEVQVFEGAKSELSRLEMAAIQASEAVATSISEIRKGPLHMSSTETTAPLSPPNCQTSGFDGKNQPHNTPKTSNFTTVIDIPANMSGESDPLRRRAATAPTFQHTPSLPRGTEFMRVHDLEIVNRTSSKDDSFNQEASSLSSASNSFNTGNNSDLMFIDHNVTTILQNLTKLGYTVATDESNRFTPTRDTEKMLSKYKSPGKDYDDNDLKGWSVQPWNAAHGADVLVWTGEIGHNGFGSEWPVCKARGLIKAPPRVLLEYLLDSSKVKEYNSMSQGRDDLLVLQDGVDTTSEESKYGFPGLCKITKSLNRPKFLPTTIEMLSLSYTKALEIAPESYITVQRSVFEDDSGELKGSSFHTIRSEMLLGVNLIRPAGVDGQMSELTNITHVYSPGVPEMIAKRVAPASAAKMIGDIQNIFKKKR